MLRWKTFAAVIVAGCLGACLSEPDVETTASGSDGGTALDPADTGDPSPDATGDGSVPADPPPKTACEAACGDAGGTCEGDVCVVSCQGPDSCKRPIRCPAGVACRVACTGKQSCAKGVECGDATSCEVRCEGEQACNGDVKSRAATTSIACVGDQACNGEVQCTAGACTLVCENGGCKVGEVDCCSATSCTVNGVPASC